MDLYFLLYCFAELVRVLVGASAALAVQHTSTLLRFTTLVGLESS